MNAKEFVEALQKIYEQEDYDTEYGHMNVDELMEVLLMSLGYQEGILLKRLVLSCARKLRHLLSKIMLQNILGGGKLPIV
jgi:hypothetical protein